MTSPDPRPDTRPSGAGLRAVQEGVRIALASLDANRVRSGLTILGVAVGVSVVVTLAALITGIRSSVLSAFEAAGPENFIVTRFDFTAVRLSSGGNDRPPWWDKPELTAMEARRIAELPGIGEALFNLSFVVDVSFEGRRFENVQARGTGSGWPAYTTGEFSAGRNFTPAELRQSRAVMVVSAALGEDLFGQRDPIGRRVRVGVPFRSGQEEFRVIGVFVPEENVFTSAVQQWVVFPSNSALKSLSVPTREAQIFVVPEDTVPMVEAQDRVIGLLRSARGLGPREENNFGLLASGQIVEVFDRLTGIFYLVMLALSSAGLLVGGVGVIGIMLISVTERTREIGVRKAVGATRREILWQFLVEASVLTLLGGAVGMILGAGVAEAVESLTPIPASIPGWAVAAALAMAALTGMLFGLLPAYRASRLEPVDALRFE